MFTLIKRPLYIFSNKFRRRRQPVERMKEKWIADFSKPEKSCFDIKPEISYNAYLEKGLSSKKNALFLGLRKKNCMAWLETANRVYVDQVIEARFCFDSAGGYYAAGIMFRVIEHGTYYLILVSNKGYFRLDAINNHIPKPLIGWTEAPGLYEPEVNLGMILKGDHLIFLLNGRWLAEVNDDSIPGGHLGFALVSYDCDSDGAEPVSSEKEAYTCKTRLNFLSVDSRARTVKTEYKKWNNSAEISAKNRFCLAESFAVLTHFDAAYTQVLRIWKQRDEVAKNITATYTETRTGKELLFAARMACRIGQYADAEEYINNYLAMETGANEKRAALIEKTKIISAQNKYDALVVFLPDCIKQIKHETGHTEIASLYALLGHAYWNLKNYKAAAAAWDTAFSLNGTNGLYAVNAANAFAMLRKNTAAQQRRLDGGKCFLQHETYAELEALIPKLLVDGKKNREARVFAETAMKAIEKRNHVKGPVRSFFQSTTPP